MTLTLAMRTGLKARPYIFPPPPSAPLAPWRFDPVAGDKPPRYSSARKASAGSL